MERLTPWNKLAMAFSPRKSMIGPTNRILRLWDEMNRQRKTVGIAGVDAHAFPIKVGPLTVEIFPYKVHFRCLRTHVLLPEPMAADFPTASRQLYNALRDCRVFCSNMRWGDAEGFEFTAGNGREQITCGGEIQIDDSTRLTVHLPHKALVRIVHDVSPMLEAETNRIELKTTEPGLYRVEAWKGKRGWIFSNHIRLRE